MVLWSENFSMNKIKIKGLTPTPLPRRGNSKMAEFALNHLRVNLLHFPPLGGG
jgi:hypothetical protein